MTGDEADKREFMMALAAASLASIRHSYQNPDAGLEEFIDCLRDQHREYKIAKASTVGPPPRLAS